MAERKRTRKPKLSPLQKFRERVGLSPTVVETEFGGIPLRPPDADFALSIRTRYENETAKLSLQLPKAARESSEKAEELIRQNPKLLEELRVNGIRLVRECFRAALDAESLASDIAFMAEMEDGDIDRLIAAAGREEGELAQACYKLCGLSNFELKGGPSKTRPFESPKSSDSTPNDS